MATERILVVEDDPEVQELLSRTLANEGYEVVCANDGRQALLIARADTPHLILLDLMIPGFSGLEVCRRLKRDPRTEQIPVVMVTAKGEESDIVAGLEIGAHDYVTKPFGSQVLLARVRGILRRRSASQPIDENAPVAVFGLEIHPGRREVVADGRNVELSYTKFQILNFLARRPGWVFTRDQIVKAVHGDQYPVTDRSVDVQIVGLRKRLGKCGDLIETVRGVGYRFREVNGD